MHDYGVIEFILKMIRWNYFCSMELLKKLQVKIRTDFYESQLYKTSRYERKTNQLTTVTSANITDGGIICCSQQYPLVYCHKMNLYKRR